MNFTVLLHAANKYQHDINSKEEYCKFIFHDSSSIDSQNFGKKLNDFAIFLMVDTSLEEMSEKSLSRQSSC